MEKLENLLTENEGHLTTEQLRSNGFSSKQIKKLLDEGFLEKEVHGLYVGSSYWPDPFYTAQHRASKSIFSHLTALYLHGFSDRDPITYMMTIPSGSKTALAKESNYNIFYYKKEFMDLGREEIKSPFGTTIAVFDIERTICDCIKYINSLDKGLVLTGLKRYLASDKRDTLKLMHYAKMLKIDDQIQTYLEVL